jgi:hypothetical protein
MRIEELQDQIYSSFYKKPCAIVGEDSYTDLVRQAKEFAVICDPQPLDEKSLQIGGCKVYSNELPGTRGCWIGEEEEMQVVRRYIKSGYFHENTIEVIGPGASTSRVWKP